MCLIKDIFEHLIGAFNLVWEDQKKIPRENEVQTSFLPYSPCSNLTYIVIIFLLCGCYPPLAYPTLQLKWVIHSVLNTLYTHKTTVFF